MMMQMVVGNSWLTFNVTVIILEDVAGVPGETSVRPQDADRSWLRSLEQAIIMFD
jgi:hypothetical protein